MPQPIRLPVHWSGTDPRLEGVFMQFIAPILSSPFQQKTCKYWIHKTCKVDVMNPRNK